MASYFSYFPEMEYVSRTTDRSSSDETIRVKNIFKRPKLRNDFANVATAFSDYMIVGDERPEQTAEAVYGCLYTHRRAHETGRKGGLPGGG